MDPTAQEPAADFHAARLRAELADWGYSDVAVLDTVDSTNQWLSRRILETEPLDLSAVVTGFQSAGRGRMNRQWFTPPGVALTFSVACAPRTAAGDPWPPEYLPWLTLLMAHSITRVARRVAGVPAVVKWPNDVLVNSRKLCGVLAGVLARPGHPAPGVVVGAGLNVHQYELPVPTATSLRLELGPDALVPTRQELFTEVLREFACCYRTAGSDLVAQLGPGGDLRAAIEADLDTIGRQVTLHLPGSQDLRPVLAQGLGPSGELLVRDDHGAVRALSAGDVVHVRASPGAGDTEAVRRAVAEMGRVTSREAS